MRMFVASFALLALLCAAPAPRSAAAAAPKKPAAITVMTQNCYIGADLVPTIAALSDPEATIDDVGAAVQSAWLIVQQTDFRTRAKALAAEIAAADPDVVALQEAVIWRSQTPSDVVTGTLLPNATTVEYDFVKILLLELRKKRKAYRVAAVTTGIDVEAPRTTGPGQFADLRLTDQDVLLVKRGVRAS